MLGGYDFSLQDCKKTIQVILLKPGGMMGRGPTMNPENFGADPGEEAC